MSFWKNSENRVAIVQINNELRNAQVELLSAQCATDRLRLRFSKEDIAQRGQPDVLRKAIATTTVLHDYYSAIEKPGSHSSAVSKPGPGITGTFRFEFDPVNKILLLRFEGRLTDELLAQICRTARIHWIATGARAGIGDYSSATEFPLSAELVRTLARQAPMPEPTERPLFIVMRNTAGYGLARMYQIVGDLAQPLVSVVRTLDEALAALGVQSPQFEPLEKPQVL
jgi:hypothetical protein